MNSNDKKMNEHIKLCKCNDAIFPLNMREILNVLGDLGGDGWWDWHLQENFEYMSPKFWEILGYNHEDKAHSPEEWQSLIFEEDYQIVKNNFDQHVATKGEYPFYQNVRYRHGSGKTIWILCRGKIIEWNGDTPVRMVGTHVDMTNDKNTIERLKEESEFFKIIFKNGLTACTIKNCDGEYEDVNDKFCELTGYSREDIIGKKYNYITAPEHLKDDEKCIDHLYKQEKKFTSLKKQIIKKNGKKIWCSILQTMVHFNGENKIYAQMVDITRRKAIADEILMIKNRL